MAEPDFRVSAESLPALEAYVALPLADARRVELFSFLAEAVARPNAVEFVSDERDLRWTTLQHVGLVWQLDIPRAEIDVIDVWDEDA